MRRVGRIRHNEMVGLAEYLTSWYFRWGYQWGICRSSLEKANSFPTQSPLGTAINGAEPLELQERGQFFRKRSCGTEGTGIIRQEHTTLPSEGRGRTFESYRVRQFFGIR